MSGRTMSEQGGRGGQRWRRGAHHGRGTRGGPGGGPIGKQFIGERLMSRKQEAEREGDSEPGDGGGLVSCPRASPGDKVFEEIIILIAAESGLVGPRSRPPLAGRLTRSYKLTAERVVSLF